MARADGSPKAAEVPAGVGVAGTAAPTAEAAAGAGAAGGGAALEAWAGVRGGTAAVVLVTGAAEAGTGAALGCVWCQPSTSNCAWGYMKYLREHANYESLLLDLVELDRLVICKNLS